MKRIAWACALSLTFVSSIYAEQVASVAVSSVTVTGQATTPIESFVWPVLKRIGGQKVEIVSKFGHRQAPGSLLDETHEGIDFAAPPEAAVRAARSGKVIFTGFSNAYVTRKDKKEKCRLVIIRHDDGMSSRYVHVERLHVKPGQEAHGGEILGIVSPSDEWTGTVVHFEIRDAAGKALDPSLFFKEKE